ncbi:MAG: bifunctional 5,10-methylenetetrahydrofolate dehydrogenase/5,10-methenyltetrahydrofolate cyclohydrolase [Candidatus Omnitrophica bacterium]|nr:bifunctional 5,10-methylenetetrahydrofolate dehydrogenase/5,10-methenyltetrahydrofolate cyclohydrolase [Candidatus Omnitrophota bacterium]
MSAQIIDGNAVASKIIAEVKDAAGKLKEKGRTLLLAAVQVGENPASKVYTANQAKSCEAAGIEYKLHNLPADTSKDQLRQFIGKLNNDNKTTGIILQMPLPPGIDATSIQSEILPAKDVEGVNPANLGKVVFGEIELCPCTAQGVYQLIKSTNVELKGKEVVMVGHSDIVGKPIALLLLNDLATVTVCHIGTRDLASHTRNADIIIVAVGKPNLITADMVKDGVMVFDVGINRIPLKDEKGNPILNDKGKPRKKIVGDVDFDKVKEKASFITPVPGGVGPMTTAMLLNHVVNAGQR